ncbi:retrovirus-related pol polyprotein from transposon TNT 1-94 [Tanacetum coccineum]
MKDQIYRWGPHEKDRTYGQCEAALEGTIVSKWMNRESQLYDDFEHFRQNKGETIHDYYVRIQTSDHLFAYLKQHEAMANENKMMLNVVGQVAAGIGAGAQNSVGNANGSQLLFLAGGQDMLLMKYVVLSNQLGLALNVDNDQCVMECGRAYDSESYMRSFKSSLVFGLRLLSKHMMGDRSRLMNFMKKFIGTVKLDSGMTTLVLLWVMETMSLVNKTLYDIMKALESFTKKTVPMDSKGERRLIERRNRTLVEAARTILIFSKAPMFLWAEVVATACYTQNRSLIHTRHDKKPHLELVHYMKPDLHFPGLWLLSVYPTNDSEILGKTNPRA